MKRSYKTLIFVAGVVVGIAAGGFYFLGTPSGVSRTVRGIVEWKLRNVRLDSFLVKDVGYSDRKYRLTDLRAVLGDKNESRGHSLAIPSLTLEAPLAALRKQRPLIVAADDVRLEDLNRSISIRGFWTKAGGSIFDPLSWTGIAENGILEWDRYRVENVNTRFRKTGKGVIFDHFAGDLYGGKVDGKIVLETDPVIYYDIILNITDLDIQKIERLHPDVFGKVRGRLRGDMRIQGGADGVRKLTGTLTADEGGKIQASLLEPLLKYIPQTQQKRLLQSVIMEDGLLPLQKADIGLSLIDAKTLVTHFDLESQEYNLDLDLTVELNVEGGLGQLLNVKEYFF